MYIEKMQKYMKKEQYLKYEIERENLLPDDCIII